MPKLRPTPTIIIALVLLAGPVGCADPGAAQQTAAVKAIADATERYSTITLGTVAPGGETFDERRSALTRLATQVRGIADPPDGRLAAKSMLSASIQRELAALGLAEANDAESEMQRRRGVTRAMIAAASRLDALATARESVDLGAPRDDLAEQRRVAEAHREEFREIVSELDIPIEELTAVIEADRVAVDELTRDANVMRREALELGAGAGFDVFEQAVNRERDADQLEYRIAHRELDLDYELNPERRIAQGEVVAAEELIDAVDASERAIDIFVENVATDSRTTRRLVEELADRINARCSESRQLLEGEAEDTLETSYRQITDHLERAAQEASAAARALPPGETDGARIAEARINAMLGQANWLQVHGIDDQVDLLDALLGADDAIGGAAAYRGWRDALMTQRTEALARSKTAYEQAQTAAGQVSGRGGGDALVEYGLSLEAALGALSGDAVPMTLSLPTGGGSSPAERPEGASGAGAPTSHEELIELVLAQARTTQGGVDFMEDYCRASTPDGRRGLAAVKKMSAAMAKLEAAMQARFGEGLSQLPGMMTMEAPELTDVRLVSETEDSAVYRHDAPPGMPGELKLNKINGRWYVEFESMMPGMDQMEITLPFLATMETAATALIPRIEAGEFGSAQEVMMAMMQGMGGAGGPGGAGRPSIPR